MEIRIAVCLILACVLPASAQREALTISRNLADLVGESHVIVRGRVISATIARHPQLTRLTTVVVTVRVEETLKGQTAETYTFRQAVLDPRDRFQRWGYRPGQDVLLFLMQPNQYGLSSPAGMEQGRFLIETGADGRLLATNAFGNAGLFHGLTAQMKARGLQLPADVRASVERTTAGPTPLDHLRSLIQVLAVEK